MVEPLEETRTELIFATEPILSSLHLAIPGSFHYTPLVELDEVEVSLLGFDFGRLLLRNVSESEDVLLTEVSIVVEAELGVHAKFLVSRINIQKKDERLARALLRR